MGCIPRDMFLTRVERIVNLRVKRDVKIYSLKKLTRSKKHKYLQKKMFLSNREKYLPEHIIKKWISTLPW